jgi:hypothetical protein
MEDKFDRYFLWGYGTLISIFMLSLAWFLNRVKTENIKDAKPPNPELKVTKSRFCQLPGNEKEEIFDLLY